MGRTYRDTGAQAVSQNPLGRRLVVQVCGRLGDLVWSW